jgi:2-(1,2-epoxy-1,2-dihydrophenyl)acetyl-CoA isomerase
MTAMPDEDGAVVLLDMRDNIAHITLNRPDAMNALNLEMAKDLLDAAMQCDETTGVRAVVIAGAGKLFCAGGDVKQFVTEAEGERLPTYVRAITTYLHAAISCLARMNAPVIAAVEGSAAGGGMSLALGCDLIIAAESARFTAAYTRIGLCPDGSMTYSLSRMVGLRRALELTLTNRTLSAREALDWGIVTAVAPDGEALLRADELAGQFAQGPTQAYGATKRLIHAGWTESLETQMMAESQAIAVMSGTADASEGMAAFVAKRSPNFRGK